MVTLMHRLAQSIVTGVRADRRALVLYGLTAVLMGLVVATGADLRRISTSLGVAVFSLLVYRVAASWDRLTLLERILGPLLAASPAVAAAASLGLMAAWQGPLPDNPWLWLVLAHRFACLLLVIVWNGVLGHRARRQVQHARGHGTSRHLQRAAV